MFVTVRTVDPGQSAIDAGSSVDKTKEYSLSRDDATSLTVKP